LRRLLNSETCTGPGKAGGIEPTDLDSIGETGGMAGSFIGAFSRR
jgi:hypothetical protein